MSAPTHLLCFSPADAITFLLSRRSVPLLAHSTFPLLTSILEDTHYLNVNLWRGITLKYSCIFNLLILYYYSSHLPIVDIILWRVFVFISLNALFNFGAAIIVILKCATTLRPTGLPVQSALSQAMSNYQKFNIGLKIAEHFTAPPRHYSIQDFVDFIMGITVGLPLNYQDNI